MMLFSQFDIPPVFFRYLLHFLAAERSQVRHAILSLSNPC